MSIDNPSPEIVAAVHYNEQYFSQQLNILNNGLIPNLPDDAIVKDGLSTPTRVWTFARGFKCEGVAVVASKGDSLDLILSFDNDAAWLKQAARHRRTAGPAGAAEL